jgi:oligoendopeptidase F
MTNELVLERPPRQFLPADFTLTGWADVQPFFQDLLTRDLASADDLRRWFIDRSELESFLSENFAWRYIRMTCNTADDALVDAFTFFTEQIQPEWTELANQLDQRAMNSPYLGQLRDEGFAITIRGMKQQIALFRSENIPLQTQLQTLQSQYGATVGAMTVELPGPDGTPEEMTLQKASDRLQLTDRAQREEAWRAIWKRRFRDKDVLDALFNQLRDLRHRVAQNAGFANFRDYSFAALGRFDYTPQDCFDFHDAVAETVVPMLDDLAEERRARLGVEYLRPWDKLVDPEGRPPLQPFANGTDLLDKTILVFDRLDGNGRPSELGRYLRVMKAMGQLDLESRKGKAPGGYNYPLEETGVPFIFMNATSNLRDLVTLLHEGGHAVHSIVTRNLLLNSFRNVPAEVAELASMSMELLTMDYWDVFFPNPDDLRRAKIQHLEGILETLPWVATIDAFQHWIYENPHHTDGDRERAWVQVFDRFSDSVTDWTELELYHAYTWQKQLHLFEVPFYYIEYGIAQLGAVAVWKRYRDESRRGNARAGLDGYLAALRLGYTRPIGEIYAAAGIPFDFSKPYIASLMQFVREELRALKQGSNG